MSVLVLQRCSNKSDGCIKICLSWTNFRVKETSEFQRVHAECRKTMATNDMCVSE